MKWMLAHLSSVRVDTFSRNLHKEFRVLCRPAIEMKIIISILWKRIVTRIRFTILLQEEVRIFEKNITSVQNVVILTTFSRCDCVETWGEKYFIVRLTVTCELILSRLYVCCACSAPRKKWKTIIRIANLSIGVLYAGSRDALLYYWSGYWQNSLTSQCSWSPTKDFIWSLVLGIDHKSSGRKIIFRFVFKLQPKHLSFLYQKAPWAPNLWTAPM